MKTNTIRTLAGLLAVPVCLSTLLFSQRGKEDEEEVFELSPFEISTGGYGVTAGGAQDISFTRSEIARGKIPRPTSFTAEGLLSEYDLPLNSPGNCSDLICVYGESMPVTLSELPEVTHLAQIGFASGIDSATWQRAPLNLIAVVDKSGSMSGKPLQLVRNSLLEALDQLDEHDQISIVLYGDRSHVYLEPTIVTRHNRIRIQDLIRQIASAGSTNMESGLRVGYDLADRTAGDFKGSTRLMLFTDEQPNTGNTSEHGFMGQMRSGSKKGYGLTTIGVGVNFGAELANRISVVRGSNLFYFPNSSDMREKFANEFETMVTELAYDMRLTLSPAKGFRIAGVFGIPGDMLRWTDDGRSLYMEVETLFLSLRKGAIYFALASSNSHRTFEPNEVATAALSYNLSQQDFPISQKISLPLINPSRASEGLFRGELLIDEYTSLKKATSLYHDTGDAEAAYQIVQKLAERLSGLNDPEIERKLVKEIENNLAIVTGKNRNFFGFSKPSPLLGTWVAELCDNPDLEEPAILKFHSDRVLELAYANTIGQTHDEYFAFSHKAFGSRRHGKIELIPEGFAYRTPELSEILETLEQDAYYLDLYTSVKYKLRGEQLLLTFFDNNEPHPTSLVLRRASNTESFSGENEYERISIEPLTGLPSQG